MIILLITIILALALLVTSRKLKSNRERREWASYMWNYRQQQERDEIEHYMRNGGGA